MGLRNMKMFLSLGILCFLVGSGFGAPSPGRYMWLKCKPDGQNANCVTQSGPVVDTNGLPDKLPASAVTDIMEKIPGLEVEEAVKEEQMVEDQVVVEPEVEGSAAAPLLSEQGSGELEDYSSYVSPEEVMIDHVMPPVQEMQEEQLLL